MYIKSLRSALVVMAVFLAVSIVAIVALASRAGVVSPLSTASPQGKSLLYPTAPLGIRLRCHTGEIQHDIIGLVEQRYKKLTSFSH
jgi:hypothetical protein